MRQPAEFFDDVDISLVHIAGTLRGALRCERVLTENGVDYAVEVDQYSGGLIFPTKRTGVFFYVAAETAVSCRELLRSHRFKVQRS